MADFESLIRNAMATQDAASPDVREAIYKSSRNALDRIIQSNRNLTVEGAIMQKERLEACISKVEQEFAPPPLEHEIPVSQEQSDYFVDENDPLYEIQQILTGGKTAVQKPVEPELSAPETEPLDADIINPVPSALETGGQGSNPVGKQSVDAGDPVAAKLDARIQQLLKSDKTPGHEPAVAEYETIERQVTNPAPAPLDENSHPQVRAGDGQVRLDNASSSQVDYRSNDELPHLSEDDAVGHHPLPPGFAKRRKKQRAGFWTLLVIGIFVALGWIGYEVYSGIKDGSLIGLEKGNTARSNNVSNDLNAKDYITILQPSDLSPLVIAGRGSAELVTQQNMQMIRISSQRDKSNREQPAEPILLRLQPGVLERVENKSLTVEIYAKSGNSNQAQFSVSCQFANGSDCGRKRFVAGVQPQASVFRFDFGNVTNTQSDYFIEIKTDTTTNAAITGEGDVLDIVYVRLKSGNE